MSWSWIDCFGVTWEDYWLKDKISEDDKKVLDKCQETLSWLDANQTTEKDEFEHHHNSKVFFRCVLQQQNSYIEADGSVTSTATPRLIIARSVQNEQWIATN
uniref:Uncharacterized protein n=1 Tax=Meloidogyne incognita TaxID=6306 RepID=A0A914NSI1_MELIC